MADTTLFTVNIAEHPTDGVPCIVGEEDEFGNRYYLRHDRVRYGANVFGPVDKGAAIPLPEVERTALGSKHWRAKGGGIGAGVVIPESELDRLIVIGATAMAIKLELAKIPTLTEDLDTVLKFAAGGDFELREVVRRLKEARTAKKISVSSS